MLFCPVLLRPVRIRNDGFTGESAGSLRHPRLGSMVFVQISVDSAMVLVLSYGGGLLSAARGAVLKRRAPDNAPEARYFQKTRTATKAAKTAAKAARREETGKRATGAAPRGTGPAGDRWARRKPRPVPLVRRTTEQNIYFVHP